MLVSYGSGIQHYQMTPAGCSSWEQAAKMRELAEQAFQAWKMEGHPGWSVDTTNGCHLPHLAQQQV